MAVPVLSSRIDRSDEQLPTERDAFGALVADLRAELDCGSVGWPGHVAGAARGPRQAAAARPGRRTARSGVTVSRAVAHGGPRHVRRRGSRRGHHHRHRSRRRAAVHGRRQRRDRQGRHVPPDHRQEAPPCPGDRAREPAAVHLPRRLRWCVPARAARGVPRPRSLRAHLLQPGPAVGSRRSPRSRR